MKNMTKKMIALFMTLLMVAAMLPITASAGQYARIVVELKEPYYGENLAELFPEIRIVSAYPFTPDGLNFTLYCAVSMQEEAVIISESLKANPIVSKASACWETDAEQSKDLKLIRFEICLDKTKDYGAYTADLTELFPDIEILKAGYYNRYDYTIFCNVSSDEEAYEIYDILAKNPDVEFLAYWDESAPIMTERIIVTVKNTSTPEDVAKLFNKAKIGKVHDVNNGKVFYVYLKDNSLRTFMEAYNEANENLDILNVSYEHYGLPMVMFQEMDSFSFITVETALQALRIAAGLDKVDFNNEKEFTDAIWQYDCDGDKVITVTDALSLLRMAAGLAA